MNGGPFATHMQIFTPARADTMQLNADAGFLHTRVVAPANGGPASLDLGYNRYKAGGTYEGPFAYNRHEFCYTAQGRTEGTSLGVAYVSEPGMFMWRPARAVTDGFRVVRDIVNVCAFSAARIDATSHRLAGKDFPQWDGRPESRFIPTRLHFSEVEPTTFPRCDSQAGITFREVFSKVDTGEHLVDVGHLELAAGATMVAGDSPEDELWWLESGALDATDHEIHVHVKPHECLSFGSGSIRSRVRALERSVVVRFAARAKHE